MSSAASLMNDLILTLNDLKLPKGKRKQIYEELIHSISKQEAIYSLGTDKAFDEVYNELHED